MSEQPPVIEVCHVSRRFSRRLDLVQRVARRLGARVHERTVHAVDDVSLTIGEGEAVGLVGESGCGKSTLGRLVAGIDTPSAGEVRFRGQPVAQDDSEAARRTALKIQMIFQDPLDSLNPRHRMGRIVGEGARYHRVVPSGEIDSHVDTVLEQVGLDPSMKSRFPHQFSGGQRQRIGIARALAVRPEVVVCDESVASLDVSIQAQIINLFMRLRAELGLAYLFISHDIGVVRHIADRVVVMYLGRVVEEGPTKTLFDAPNHPYTQALMSEVPRLDNRHVDFNPITGEIPSPLDPPSGCHFHPRCPHAHERCRMEVPRLKRLADGRFSACHLNDA